MTHIEAIIRAAIGDGEPLTLPDLGGEEAVYSAAAQLSRTTVFGDIVELLCARWPELAQPEKAQDFIVLGFTENQDYLVVSHAADAVAVAPIAEVRPFVMALERRARDGSSSEGLRLTAATAVIRFAIREERWRATASATLVALEDVTDEYAIDQLSHLAAVGWEYFRDREMLSLLERHQASPQALYERGVVALALALEQDTLDGISLGIREAKRWLQRSVDLEEDRRDAQMYLHLTEVLDAVARAEPAPKEVAGRLREEVIAHFRWDEPRPGAEWLLPSHEAELQWIPLIDQLVRVSERLTEPSWLDAATVLGEVMKMYLAVRSIRPGMPGIERVVRPAIEAAFVREAGLLAHLDQWLGRDGIGTFEHTDAERLRQNIDARRASGKSRGATANGR
jgi:hypothetical protein